MSLRSGGSPDLCIENQGVRILNHPPGICRNPIPLPPGPMHAQPKQIAVGQRVKRQPEFPGALVCPLHRKTGRRMPIRHLPDQIDAGGMRRTHLRGHEKILKRLLVHIAGFNLGLLMCRLIGRATPRAYAETFAAIRIAALALIAPIWRALARQGRVLSRTDPRADWGSLMTASPGPTLARTG